MPLRHIHLCADARHYTRGCQRARLHPCAHAPAFSATAVRPPADGAPRQVTNPVICTGFTSSTAPTPHITVTQAPLPCCPKYRTLILEVPHIPLPPGSDPETYSCPAPGLKKSFIPRRVYTPQNCLKLEQRCLGIPCAGQYALAEAWWAATLSLRLLVLASFPAPDPGPHFFFFQQTCGCLVPGAGLYSPKRGDHNKTMLRGHRLCVVVSSLGQENARTPLRNASGHANPPQQSLLLRTNTIQQQQQLFASGVAPSENDALADARCTL